MKKTVYAIAFLLAVVLGAAMFALFANIGEKKAQERAYPLMLNKVSDENPDYAEWGKNFPSQLGSFLEMATSTNTPTEFGGSLPYSKIIRYPQIQTLWGGYAFAVDFNEERSHFYTQIDQMETMRTNKEYLNTHGLPAFKGQPGACMNCHTGWLTWLINKKGWDFVNEKPYFEVIDVVKQEKGDGPHGSHMGSTCADCHNPDDMSLRITRPAYINAMVARGYESNPKQGIKANRQEMRSHVCQQCHVEYYFQGKGNTLTFPWNEWKKGEIFRIEMLDEYYDKARENGTFAQDWLHKDTKAQMLKVQHPETELSSSGIHARSGVGCADCHMPYKREGAVKVTDHFIKSPLENINASCKTCHMQSEDDLKLRVQTIQRATASSLREAENAVVALIADIKTAREKLAALPEFASITDAKERDAAISKVLKDALENHRKASMRWDFIFSENSTGFHSPQEAARVLAQSIDLARSGQSLVQNAIAAYGINFPITIKATMPEAPAQIELHHAPVNSLPPKIATDADIEVQKVNF
ncbi:ammonia-forming cytochrome c nitrite reductase subunit c552 [Campylobacter geochelonis]|uniref:nitrite reductase (cytochrome; ammonia-forming) n=1 Tax=Campylobacter geochelonis TaxID=1780362 RepID=A0A128EIA9_9BACT|nr:ammonia-forming cytochrome c nitrite reductase subunit c552 [Campylobacter geochelonis]QKF70743.1 formate-dependent nitrite reductase NrfAH, periplasmic pentaheme cytochrome c subunit [Campylobacter geochelonis]CZE48590.1 nitrite reductase (cytochrome%3B ammonia-forming) [Campylobacter geochelonis]